VRGLVMIFSASPTYCGAAWLDAEVAQFLRQTYIIYASAKRC